LGSARPLAWSVHCCSKVSRCSCITRQSAVFSGCRREYTGLADVGCVRAAASTKETCRRTAHGSCAAAVSTLPRRRTTASVAGGAPVRVGSCPTTSPPKSRSASSPSCLRSRSA
jgi:hypothetical protein